MGMPLRQVFVCTQMRAPGHPKGSCGARGGQALLQALGAELQKRGCWESVGLTYCGCLGACDGGPTAVVYPDGALLRPLTPADVPALFDRLLGAESLAESRAEAQTAAPA